MDLITITASRGETSQDFTYTVDPEQSSAVVTNARSFLERKGWTVENVDIRHGFTPEG